MVDLVKEKSNERSHEQTKNSGRKLRNIRLEKRDDDKRENYTFTATLFINSARRLVLLSSLVLQTISSCFSPPTVCLFGCVSHSICCYERARPK